MRCKNRADVASTVCSIPLQLSQLEPKPFRAGGKGFLLSADEDG
jgi:hypothetical protein